MLAHVDILAMPIMLQLNNLGVRALVEYCKSTLTSVDLSDCTSLNDEVCLAVRVFPHFSAVDASFKAVQHVNGHGNSLCVKVLLELCRFELTS